MAIMCCCRIKIGPRSMQLLTDIAYKQRKRATLRFFLKTGKKSQFPALIFVVWYNIHRMIFCICEDHLSLFISEHLQMSAYMDFQYRKFDFPITYFKDYFSSRMYRPCRTVVFHVGDVYRYLSFSAVQGAKFDPRERPPEGVNSHLHTVAGWSGPPPPGGVLDMPQREIENTIQQFLDGQLDTSR